MFDRLLHTFRSAVSLCRPGLRALAFGCALGFATAGHAQQLSLQRYGKAEGLNNQNVRCLMQSRDRHLWACTENGLYRYDGRLFRRYGEDEGLDDTLVDAALEDRHGRIWVNTHSDLYVGERGRFRPVRPGGTPLASAGDYPMALLPDGRIAMLIRHQIVTIAAEGDDAAWTAQPLFTPQERAQTPELDKVHSLYQGADGRLWFGCARSICEAGPAGVRVWGAAEGVESDQWMRFLVDRHGQLWARGYNHLLMRPTGAQAFERSGLPDAALRSQPNDSTLAEGQDGSIVVRNGAGFARYARGRWGSFTVANGLLSEDVVTMLFDHEGSLWLSTGGHGLQRWIGSGRIESWTRAQGFDSDTIWKLLRVAPDRLLVGTRGACMLLDQTTGRAERCAIDGLPVGELVTAARAADGGLWLRSPIDNELLHVAPGSQRAQPIAKLPRFFSMFVDSQQRVWLPTRSGIYLLEPGSTQPRLIGEESEMIDAAEDASGAMWFSSAAGLFRYAEGRLTRAAEQGPHARTGFSSIAIGRDGTLWAASRARGVLRATIRGEALDNAQWVDDPMIADVSAMLVRLDARQRIWIGTEFGIVGHDGQRWRRVSESDGLIWNDVDFNSFHADDDGSIWVGTSGGLSHIVDPQGALDQPSPSLAIADARYNGQALQGGSGGSWPWSRAAALDLDLVSFSFGRSPNSVFRYRIAGVDGDWFESSVPLVHYPALDPGQYRFEAMLVDRDRGLSSPIVGLDFTVLPPWWGTLGFRALAALLTVAALAIAWRWQLRRITARHASEQRLVREHTALLERASRDGLTGLWNRAAILDLLAQAIERRAPDEPLALAVLDVDHFKRVNDSHGHAAGDALLRSLSQRVTGCLRQVDRLGRYGGEELLLVLPGLPCEEPPPAVERLRDAVAAEPFDIGDGQIAVTVSIGVAWFNVGDLAADPTQTADTPEKLFERADSALYRAKHGGRNRVCCALPQPSAQDVVAQAKRADPVKDRSAQSEAVRQTGSSS